MVSSRCPPPPLSEQAVGMRIYLTSERGIGGRIKTVPEDFFVEEIICLPSPSYGKHVIARITACNWETNALLTKLARNLHISRDAIGFAGMKDKRAVTVQLMSFPTIIDKVSALSIKGVTVEALYTASRPIYRGQLKGNKFQIVIRNVDTSTERALRIRDSIAAIGGMPNFFGIQRFGVMRPITHLIGKYILMGHFERAVMTYIANPIAGEPDSSFRVRQILEDTRDFAGALEYYPNNLQFERTIIRYLASHPKDWTGALQQLPSNLTRMFVHAYQSFIFNLILSRRQQEDIPIHKASIGDIVFPLDRGCNLQDHKGIMVTNHNLRKIDKQIAKGNCFPTAPLIGYDSQLAEGNPGDIEQAIIYEEKIEPAKFHVPSLPQFASAGMRRIVFSPVSNLQLNGKDDTLHLAFSLKKGSYATSLLREFMKAPITSY